MMLPLPLTVFATAVVHCACGTAAEGQQIPLLPIPRQVRADMLTGIGPGSSTAPAVLHADFAAVVHSAVAASPKVAVSDAAGHARLDRAVQRFGLLVAPARKAAARQAASAAAAAHLVLRRLDLYVENFSDELSIETNVAYTLSVHSTKAVGRAKSIYGAMYAMTTFAQLVDAESGEFNAANLTISDAPELVWRGLMVDTGRRFAPLSLLRNLIDTMSTVKLNVLHLHLSDFCRFAVESKLYPNLTASLIGLNAGHYTQDEIRGLLVYAKDRGVRVVPEFEMPGHALGLKPISTPGGLEFCKACAYPDGCMPSQLKATAGTFRVLHDLLGEMATLFIDDVFHIGADETFVKSGDGCDESSTAALEKQVVHAVASDFNKTPAGWEQVLFKTAAATKDTIVYSYMQSPGVAAVTAAGYRAVECNASMYFTVPMVGSPTNWANIWCTKLDYRRLDIGRSVPATERPLLLGGEMAAWTDTYCNPRECGAMHQYHPEKGSALYNRSRDAEYARSYAGMIWPRGIVGAAALWNWNGSIDSQSPEFIDAIWRTNDRLAKSGSLVCPSRCSCDQISACGKPYDTHSDQVAS